MRVFVFGTGRCGTATFAAAMRHATNYTTGHESRRRFESRADLDFGDRHVEVSAQLAWMLGALYETHGERATYVHLWRRRSEVIDSWVRRGPEHGPGRWGPFAAGGVRHDRFRELCELCYDTAIWQCERFVLERKHGLSMPLHRARERWPQFWFHLGCEGDLGASVAEWDVKHNEGDR